MLLERRRPGSLIPVPPDPRPSGEEIRRALAECMTVTDIDDAMGWAPGTARRRRWRAPDRGGLPYADAELGGVALWFRSTIEAWQDTRVPRTRRDRDARRPDADPDQMPGAAHRVEVAARGVPAQPPTAATEPPDDPSDSAQAIEPGDLGSPTSGSAANETGQDGLVGCEQDVEQARPRPTEESGSLDEAAAEPVQDEMAGVDERAVDAEADGLRSGFELEVGQRVLADVHGRWRKARVSHRDRATVVVDYNLDDTPRGIRRQRIAINRVRIPADQ